MDTILYGKTASKDSFEKWKLTLEKCNSTRLHVGTSTNYIVCKRAMEFI